MIVDYFTCHKCHCINKNLSFHSGTARHSILSGNVIMLKKPAEVAVVRYNV